MIPVERKRGATKVAGTKKMAEIKSENKVIPEIIEIPEIKVEVESPKKDVANILENSSQFFKARKEAAKELLQKAKEAGDEEKVKKLQLKMEEHAAAEIQALKLEQQI